MNTSKPTLAIIGTGIAGLGAAWYLRDHFDITLYDKNNYPGGHTNTIAVEENGREVPIDTGFMVYNETTYPKLIRLFEELDIRGRPTDMSFGVNNLQSGLEYACTGLNSFFAQRLRFADPRHWSLMREILRFFKAAKLFLMEENDPGVSLAEFLDKQQLSKAFRYNYLLPQTGAIWSTPPDRMLEYPALALLRFLRNHHLLGVGVQLPWLTLKGGSRTYRDRLLQQLPHTLLLNRTVNSVDPLTRNHVVVSDKEGHHQKFNKVIIATHADEALALLDKPTPQQKHLLSAFSYNRNPVTLHSDASVMPRQKRAWASWNFRMEAGKDKRLLSSTHYWMNQLQDVSQNQDYFVSVDYQGDIDPAKLHWQTTYHHPCFTERAIRSQQHLPQLNSEGPIHFCGSYFGYGFHEDALSSGVELADTIKHQLTHSHELAAL